MEQQEIKKVLTDFAEWVNAQYPFEFVTKDEVDGYIKKNHKPTKPISYRKWFQKQNQQ